MARVKILVVEDEAITAKDLQDELRGLGYDAPAIASSGEGAIKKAEEIKPDLVLMDIVLKGDMDGIEAAELIRDRFDIPVVYVTAYLDEERLEKTKVTEPYGYIIKPFEDKDLRPTIEMALQRHKLEKALRESEGRFRTIVETAPSLLIITDAEGNNIYVSPSCEVITGYTQEELRGERIWWVHEDDTPMAKELFEHTFREGVGDKNFEYKAVKKNGDLWYASSSWEPLKDEKGKFKGIVFQTIDISERKQAEERIEHLNSVLKAIRKVNQLITMEKDRDRLLQSACGNLIETRGYYNAWIALIDESGSLVTTAEAGLGKDFLPLVERLKRGELTDCGRKALVQLQVVATEDPFSTCTDCPLSDKYHDRGALTVRLEYWEKVYGLLSVSIPKELIADEEEQNLFKELAGDLAFALYSIGLEEERKRAEEKYRLLAESAQDHIFIIDSDMRIQYSNQFAAGLLGYRPEEIIGKHLEEVFPPDLSNRLKHNLQTVFESGEPLHIEDRFTLHDKELWLDTRLIPLKTESGEIKSILGISRDITDRKQAEEEIKKLSSAVEQSIDGIAIGDLEPKLTYVNDAFARMHGYSSEEMIGMKVVNLHNEEQMDEYKSGMNQIKTQGGWVGEIGHIRKDGTPFPTYMSVTLLKGADGKPTGILAVARDITERKQAEDSLRESGEKIRSITASAHDAIIMADNEETISFWNDAAERIFGYTAEEMIGTKLHGAIIPERFHEAALTGFKSFRETGQGAAVGKILELAANRKDGTEFPVELSLSAVKLKGKWTGIGIIRDITELKKKTEAMKRFNKLAVGRELRMIELKKEINALLEDQDKEPRYKIAGEGDEKDYEL